MPGPKFGVHYKKTLLKHSLLDSDPASWGGLGVYAMPSEYGFALQIRTVFTEAGIGPLVVETLPAFMAECSQGIWISGFDLQKPPTNQRLLEAFKAAGIKVHPVNEKTQLGVYLVIGTKSRHSG